MKTTHYEKFVSTDDDIIFFSDGLGTTVKVVGACGKGGLIYTDDDKNKVNCRDCISYIIEDLKQDIENIEDQISYLRRLQG